MGDQRRQDMANQIKMAAPAAAGQGRSQRHQRSSSKVNEVISRVFNIFLALAVECRGL